MQVLFSQDPEEKTRSIMRAHYKIPDPVGAKKTYPALASSDKKVTEEKVTQARVTSGVGVTTQAGNYNHSATQQAQESADKKSNGVGEMALQVQSNVASMVKNHADQNGGEQPERRTIRDTEVYKMMLKRCAHAIFTFRFTNTINWKSVKVIPRGSIVVSGLVQLETPLDYLTVEVIGVWDPKTKAYDTRNCVMGLRMAKKKRQRPLLG